MDNPCASPCEPKKEKFSLWGLSYHLTDNEGIDYKGVAVVLARDAQHAQQIFKTNSAFNANQNLIVVEACAQIPDWTESGLCIEAYTDGENIRLNYGA